VRATCVNAGEGCEPPAGIDEDSPMAAFHCSFCGRARRAVRKLISGPHCSPIWCDECLELCEAIIAEEDRQSPDPA
jgi:hypothetical protein